MPEDFRYSSYQAWLLQQPKVRGSGMLDVGTVRVYASQLRQLFHQQGDAVVAPFAPPYVWPTTAELDAWLDSPSRSTRQRAFTTLCVWASTFDAVDINGNPVGSLLPPEFDAWTGRQRTIQMYHLNLRALFAVAEQKPIFVAQRHSWCTYLSQPTFYVDPANEIVTMHYCFDWHGRNYSGIRHFTGLSAAAVYEWNRTHKLRYLFHDNLDAPRGTRLVRQHLIEAEQMHATGTGAFSLMFEEYLRSVLVAVRTQHSAVDVRAR